MRAAIIVAAVPALATAMGVSPASAQPAHWTNRARVSINFGGQFGSESFTTTATKPVYVENAVFTTTYASPTGSMFDGGVAVRLKGNFGVGVGVSSFNGKGEGAVTGTVPHPFLFNTPRQVSGTASGLERNELATHIQAVYVIPRGKLDVAIAGGPSWLNVKQDLVTDVIYAETYPYDVATFTSATTNRVTKSALGFNVGVDVGVRFSAIIGVGGIVRFTRAPTDLSAANGVAVKVNAGGVQVGGGLRVYF
jgi:hypothetical protein